MNEPSPSTSRSSSPHRPSLLIVALPLAAACAIVPLVGMRALGGPWWSAVVVALIVFPVLPLVWHVSMERGGAALRPRAPLDRLALRSLALGLVVVAVSLTSAGPGQISRQLLGLLPVRKAAPAPPPASPPGKAGSSRHDLESFIPADAGMVVAVQGSTVIQQLLRAHNARAGSRLLALEKCQIPIDKVRVLIATRSGGGRLVVVRAPGITEVRNLYCLVGVLGRDHISLRFTSEANPVGFEVQGLFAETLRFAAVDDRTLVLSDGAAADGKPAGDAGGGSVGAALERVDRSAHVWAVGVTRATAGPWDLALDVRDQGGRLRLRASSLPPSGSADRADLEMTVPLAFAAALPGAALEDGARAVIAAISAIGGGLAGAPAPTAPGPP